MQTSATIAGIRAYLHILTDYIITSQGKNRKDKLQSFLKTTFIQSKWGICTSKGSEYL